MSACPMYVYITTSLRHVYFWGEGGGGLHKGLSWAFVQDKGKEINI